MGGGRHSLDFGKPKSGAKVTDPDAGPAQVVVTAKVARHQHSVCSALDEGGALCTDRRPRDPSAMRTEDAVFTSGTPALAELLG